MTDIITPNTAEWFDARCGRVTASMVYNATHRLKRGGWSVDRENYMVQLATERLTGIATRHFVSSEMLWGIEKEPDARAAYEYLFDVDVTPVGFVQHPTIHFAGATPDGTHGKGLNEFKCPTSAEHTRTILTKEIKPEYIAQMALQLASAPEYEYVDYGSYDPRFPPELRLWVFRYTREANAKYIAQLEADVREFLDELADMVDKLRATGRMEQAA